MPNTRYHISFRDIDGKFRNGEWVRIVDCPDTKEKAQEIVDDMERKILANNLNYAFAVDIQIGEDLWIPMEL